MREKAAVLRAGLVAATVYNVNRKKGNRAAKPSDYLRKEAVILSPGQMEREMDTWASSGPAMRRKKKGKGKRVKERRKV